MVNNMLDIIKSYFKKENYYLIFTSNSIHIKNYKKIINIDESEVIIEISNKIVKIKGNNLTLKKTIGKDATINGLIESVKYL